MNIFQAAAAATFTLVLAPSAGAERPAPSPISCPLSFDGEGSDDDEATAQSLASKDAYRACDAVASACPIDCGSARLEPGACYPTGGVDEEGTMLTYFTCTATVYPLGR